MFDLSYEMLDTLNYQKDNTIAFDVGIADSLSKNLASRILLSVLPNDSSMKLSCFESTHDLLMAKLREHKLDMILSECAGESLKYPEILSKKLGQSSIGFFSSLNVNLPFPACLEALPLLIPSRNTSLGQQVYRWFDDNGLKVNITGEFDDSAMMKAFGFLQKGIFIAPSIYKQELIDHNIMMIGEITEIQQEYHVMFAERMIQHPALKRLLATDFTLLFSGKDLKVHQV